MLELRHVGNHQSSTPARPASSVPYDRGAMYHRSPPEAHHISNPHSSQFQDPYSEFSYHERRSDLSYLHDGNVSRPRYSQQTDNRWQPPSFYDPHRQFDNRAYQSQFASNNRGPGSKYQRSPDHYLASSGGQSYDGQPPTGEVSRSFLPDTQFMHPELPHGQSQGMRPAAPYEPRTELQRTYLGNGAHHYHQGGLGEHYYDGRHGSYYGDQRPAGFEQHRMERDVSGRNEALVDKVGECKVKSGYKPSDPSGWRLNPVSVA